MGLRDFFQLNRDLIVFLYGQVFFVMGLAIALQSRRYSRLDLARSVTWLAAFGIIHGIYEWGDILVAAQTQILAEPLLRLLIVGYLLLLAGSFACLLQFGVSLVATFTGPHTAARVRLIPLGVFVAWAVVTVLVLSPLSRNFEEWQRASNALSRYAIGLPGAVLAAYALRRHALERVAPLGVPEIVKALRAAGIALAAYGVFGGLIAPPAPFPPALWLNGVVFQDFVGVPVIVFRAASGLVLLIAVVRGLEVFEVETGRLIEAMEQQQIIASERDRIGRDLHDGAIQLVYTAGLLVESAHKLAVPDTPIANRLDRAVAVLRDAITTLRRNMGELRATPTEASLVGGLRQIASDPRFTSFVDVSLDAGQLECDAMASSRTDHILAIVNEAVSNVVRHARARRVAIAAGCSAGRLHVSVQDDGVGMPKDVRAGYGLRNMRDRARLLGGSLDVRDGPRRGVVVTLDVPVVDVA